MSTDIHIKRQAAVLLVDPYDDFLAPAGKLRLQAKEVAEEPEEIEIARALESQAALAIQVTQLAKAAKQSALLAERNRLAGEIHDGLAQSFTAICLQLGVAQEELSAKEGDPLRSIQRAVELANFGLTEARRYAHNLRLNAVDESGLGHWRYRSLPPTRHRSVHGRVLHSSAKKLDAFWKSCPPSEPEAESFYSD